MKSRCPPAKSLSVQLTFSDGGGYLRRICLCKYDLKGFQASPMTKQASAMQTPMRAIIASLDQGSEAGVLAKVCGTTEDGSGKAATLELQKGTRLGSQ